MNSKKMILVAVMALFIGSTLYGCANYAKVGAYPTWDWRARPNIKTLQDNWTDYDIYTADVSWTGWPVCTLFDPKDDDRNLTGRTWTRVNDDKRFSDQISYTETFTRGGYPDVLSILGSDDQVWGYLYCQDNFRAVAKLVDDKTMYVYRPFAPSQNDASSVEGE